MMTNPNYLRVPNRACAAADAVYRFLTVVSLYDNDSLVLFLDRLPQFCDAVVVLDLRSVDRPVLSDLPSKVRFVLPCRSSDSRASVWKRIESQIWAEWVCFLAANERFDPRFCKIEEVLRKKEIPVISIYKVATLNGSDYLQRSDKVCSIYPDGGIYNTDRCTTAQITATESHVLSSGRIGHSVLMLSDCSDDRHKSCFSLNSDSYRIDSIYGVNDRYESFEKIKDAELPEQLSGRLDKIATYIVSTPPSGYLSLYAADSGIILLLAQLYLKSGNQLYMDRLHRLIDSLDLGDYIPVSFCSGLAGYGWLLTYLTKKDLIEVSEEYFQEIDSVLADHLRSEADDQLFDPLHESISIGRYFLARGNRTELEYLLRELYKARCSDLNEVKWVTYNSRHDLYVYDFGLAHGMAGILYFITKCYQAGVAEDLCTEMIEGLFRFYKHNEQDYDLYDSFFPSSVPIEDYNTNRQYSGCRLAWCYGDIGVFYSLFFAGRSLCNNEITQFALTGLKTIAEKRCESRTHVADAMFCHGSSALMHIYNRMYYHTGDSDFKQAAKYWCKATIVLGSNADSDSGYVFLTDNNGTLDWQETNGVLEGVAGVALSLLSALDYSHIDWDECMMLS